MQTELLQQALDNLHNNHMAIEKTKFLAREYMYWKNIYVCIEITVKYSSTCLGFQQTQLKEKIITHEIPDKQ